MPNTLAHLGVQGLATRTLLRDADLKWVYVGCVIPDIPWIVQRATKVLPVAVDLYDLRLYSVVQATLGFCLLLSFALAMLSARFWRSFTILALNSFLHLFLDALQVKWANGVHFLAPFSWRLTCFELFWPESVPTYFLTAFGLIYLVVNWRPSIRFPFDVKIRPFTRIYMLIVLIAIYFILPFFLLNGPKEANNHFVKTLSSRNDRSGSYVELDRVIYVPKPSGDVLGTFAKEEIRVEGIKLDHSASVSVRGTFVGTDLIRVSEKHVHARWFRSGASYMGLGLVGLLWSILLIKSVPKAK